MARESWKTEMSTILVAGGAGYIGSHMVKLLLESGHEALVLDNLCAGHGDAVPEGKLIEGDLADRTLLQKIFGDHEIDGVMHFAAHAQVGESMVVPEKYYRNNVVNTLNLLEAMLESGVNAFIFSSTAAVFGEPQYVPIDEAHERQPINPYGRSKWMVEQMLQDFDQAHGLKYIALRYFNAAGADPDGQLGERHDPETHLIPIVLQAAAGKRDAITIFGDDYDTPDGTCVRDYIHIVDLCQAHLLALEKLSNGADSGVHNLGNGSGFSVREVIDSAAEVTGREIPVVNGERRPGDPAKLVADSKLAREELGWSPAFPELGTIVEHAWKWEQRGAR